MTPLEQAISRRGVQEVVHFTTNRGLIGILAKGALLSRPLLRREDLLRYVAYPNTQYRQEESAGFDKQEDWVNYVNFSITNPNGSFFRISRDWHLQDDVYWVVLVLDVRILLHTGVYFTTTNNVYQGCVRRQGVEGFEGMFASQVTKKPGWTEHRSQKRDNQTTCNQAEVLYPVQVDASNLVKVYVANEQDLVRTRASLAEFDRPDVEVTLDQSKFG